MIRVEPPVQNVLEPVETRQRTCCGVLADIIRKVIPAVKAFFLSIWQFCVRVFNGAAGMVKKCIQHEKPRGEPFRPRAEAAAVFRPVPWQPAPVPDFGNWMRPVPARVREVPEVPIPDHNFGNWNFGRPHYWQNLGIGAAQPEVRIVDEPVDMERLKQALRNKGGVDATRISSRMTVRQFIELIDEFPDEKIRVGAWATKWAEKRHPKLDPAHPYYAIAQDAMRFKDQLQGAGHPDDLAAYAVEQERYEREPRFPLIMKSIIGFQELTRPENEELIRKLDNKIGEFNENPAFKVARALSKLYAYPNEAWKAEKIWQGAGAIGVAYQLAKTTDKLRQFYDECFVVGDYCFDIRVTNFQEFSRRIVVSPSFADFNVDLTGDATVARKVGEYYRVFRNTQIQKFVNPGLLGLGRWGLNYANFKALIDRGAENNHNTRAFYANYCTRDNFAAWLQEEGQPIKENGVPIAREVWEGAGADHTGAILGDEFWS